MVVRDEKFIRNSTTPLIEQITLQEAFPPYEFFVDERISNKVLNITNNRDCKIYYEMGINEFLNAKVSNSTLLFHRALFLMHRAESYVGEDKTMEAEIADAFGDIVFELKEYNNSLGYYNRSSNIYKGENNTESHWYPTVLDKCANSLLKLNELKEYIACKIKAIHYAREAIPSIPDAVKEKYIEYVYKVQRELGKQYIHEYELEKGYCQFKLAHDMIKEYRMPEQQTQCNAEFFLKISEQRYNCPEEEPGWEDCPC